MTKKLQCQKCVRQGRLVSQTEQLTIKQWTVLSHKVRTAVSHVSQSLHITPAPVLSLNSTGPTWTLTPTWISSQTSDPRVEVGAACRGAPRQSACRGAPRQSACRVGVRVSPVEFKLYATNHSKHNNHKTLTVYTCNRSN